MEKLIISGLKAQISYRDRDIKELREKLKNKEIEIVKLNSRLRILEIELAHSRTKDSKLKFGKDYEKEFDKELSDEEKRKYSIIQTSGGKTIV